MDNTKESTGKPHYQQSSQEKAQPRQMAGLLYEEGRKKTRGGILKNRNKKHVRQ
jgi:flagellin-specific chaperone FliS